VRVPSVTTGGGRACRVLSLPTSSSHRHRRERAAGNLTQTTLPAQNGSLEERSYDRAGRLIRVRSVKGEAVVADLIYTPWTQSETPPRELRPGRKPPRRGAPDGDDDVYVQRPRRARPGRLRRLQLRRERKPALRRVEQLQLRPGQPARLGHKRRRDDHVRLRRGGKPPAGERRLAGARLPVGHELRPAPARPGTGRAGNPPTPVRLRPGADLPLHPYGHLLLPLRLPGLGGRPQLRLRAA
jgi:hypothetical protein